MTSDSRLEALVVGSSFSTGDGWSLSLTHAIPISATGVDSKGKEYTSAVLGLDF